jgi:quercetin dioxygenase-like cupin family protein
VRSATKDDSNPQAFWATIVCALQEAPAVDHNKAVAFAKEISMKVQHYSQTELQPVTMEGSEGCQVRWLIGKGDHAPNFAMRQFEVAVGGHTPRHFHPYEHEVFVLRGRGEIVENDRVHSIQEGDCIYVAPDEIHQFRNVGDRPLEFLCLVPNSAADQRVTVVPECGVEPEVSAQQKP